MIFLISVSGIQVTENANFVCLVAFVYLTTTSIIHFFARLLMVVVLLLMLNSPVSFIRLHFRKRHAKYFIISSGNI